MPLRTQGYCAVGRGLSGHHWVWYNARGPHLVLKVKRESEVAQCVLTLSDPMDCSLPGSSIHGIFQEHWSTRDEALLHYTTPSGVPRGPSQLHSISVFSEAP